MGAKAVYSLLLIKSVFRIPEKFGKVELVEIERRILLNKTNIDKLMGCSERYAEVPKKNAWVAFGRTRTVLFVGKF